MTKRAVKLAMSNMILQEHAGRCKKQQKKEKQKLTVSKPLGTGDNKLRMARTQSGKLTVSNALLREQAGIGKNKKRNSGRQIQQQQETVKDSS